jgi:surface protein
MFQACLEIEYFDLSNFDTSNVTDMGWMFNYCHKLKEIKGINNFNTSKVTNMEMMFNECKALEYLDLYAFNTSEVTDMGWMFNECHKLKEIKGINNFNTSNVSNMSTMFQECYDLEYLDLTNFNIHNVTDMEAMFNKCHKLKEIKGINNFDLNNVKNKNKIFNGCNNLNQIILSKFNGTISNNNEKHIYVIFHTINWSINCFVPCYTSDNFTTVEEKLYDEYPELKNKQIYFTANGNTINKYDTLEKNNIKICTNILINYY